MNDRSVEPGFRWVRDDPGPDFVRRDLLWLPRRAALAGRVEATHYTFTPSLNHYRLRNDDGGEGSGGATWIAVVDTSGSVSTDTNFRLRISVAETAGGSNTNTQFQLQASLNGGTLQDVTSTSTIVKAVSSTQIAEGDATTQLVSSGTFVTGECDVGDGLAGEVNSTIDYSGNDVSEVEYVLQIVGADVADSDAITFAVTYGGGTAVPNGVTPTLSVSKTALGGTIGQALETDSATSFGSSSAGALTGWTGPSYATASLPTWQRPYLIFAWYNQPSDPGSGTYGVIVGSNQCTPFIQTGSPHTLNLDDDDGTTDSWQTSPGSAAVDGTWHAVAAAVIDATTRQAWYDETKDATPDTQSTNVLDNDHINLGAWYAGTNGTMPGMGICEVSVWDVSGFSATDLDNLVHQLSDQTLGAGSVVALDAISVNEQASQPWTGRCMEYWRAGGLNDLTGRLGLVDLSVQGSLSDFGSHAPVQNPPNSTRHGIGVALETDTANGMTASKAKAVGQTSETETAQSVLYNDVGGITGWGASNYLSVASPVTARPFLLACWMYCPTLPGLPPYSAPIGVGAFGASVDYYHIHWGNSYVFNLEEDDGTNDSNGTGTSALSSSVWYAVGGEFIGATSRQVHANALEDAAPDTLSVVMENVDTLTVGRQPASYVQNMPSDAVLSHFMIWDLTGFSATDRANLWTQIYDQTLGFGGDHARHPLDINADVGQAWSGALLWYVRGSSTSDLADQIGSANLTVNGTLSNSTIDAPVEGAPPGPTTVSIGQASEADSAQAIGKAKAPAATGQASEADSVPGALAASKLASIGAAAETETAEPVSRGPRSIGIGEASETETAEPVAFVRTNAIGEASEADSGLAFGKAKLAALGEATEADSGLAFSIARAYLAGLPSTTGTAEPFAWSKAKVIGGSSESETSNGLSWSKLAAIVAASDTESALAMTRGGFATPILEAAETDSGFALSASKALGAGLGSEADVAEALGAGKAAAIGFPSTTESAFAFAYARARSIGLSTEAASALALSFSKARAIGLAADAETAFPVYRGGYGLPIGESAEADSALGLAGSKAASIGAASATETALALLAAKAKAVGESAETDSAFPVSRKAPAGVIGTASETDAGLSLAWTKALGLSGALSVESALAASLRRSYAVGEATSVETALALAVLRSYVPGVATEADVAVALSFAKLLAIGLASEAESANGFVGAFGRLAVAQSWEAPAAVRSADAPAAVRLWEAPAAARSYESSLSGD